MNDLREKTLFILDGTALSYRSYFAMSRNPLINSRGLDTSAVFGFTNTLFSILRKEKPDFIVSVFDARGPTFRHERYAAYKATREKMPPEMADQLPLIGRVLEALRIPAVEKQGFEADDIMATLAIRAENEGMLVYMVTGDKDMMQVVSERVKMYSFGRGAASGQVLVRGPAEVAEKMGVGPEKIIDYLGLTGDSSDNIPGVPGVGPKTAVKLLEEFGSFDGVYRSLDKITSKNLQKKLADNRENALLSRSLVVLDTEVELDLSLEDLVRRAPDPERTRDLFRELEFSRLLRNLDELRSVPDPDRVRPERRYRTVTTRAALKEFTGLLAKQTSFALDTETTSVSPMRASLVGLSFCWQGGEAWYIPVRVPEEDRKSDLFESDVSDGSEDPAAAVQKRVLDAVKDILEDPDIKKCGQNIKYDMLVLRRCGVELKGVDFDSMVAAYLIDPASRSLSIDSLAQDYLGMQKISIKNLIGSGAGRITMDKVPLEKTAEYACEDADAAWQLRTILEKKLDDMEMSGLFRDVEVPLIPVLADMEYYGVAVDAGQMAAISQDIDSRLHSLETEIYTIAGEEFNINSPKQLGVILYEKLNVHREAGWKRVRRTKTGYATDVKVLEALSMHPLPRKILDYRQLKKLQSTYVDVLPGLVDPETGRIHASFNQTITATGRLSTSDPNLQNIPIKTDWGRKIRRAFVPGNRGWKLLSADYSQIELRIMAHVSSDESLIDSFRRDEDVHRRMASEILSIEPDAVTEDQRRMAKTINFGVMYGMGAYGLAGRLHISHAEAREFIDAYFRRYPRINTYMAETIAAASRDGYVATLLNRKRSLPELSSGSRGQRGFAERTAVNTPIQGTAADIIKLAMLRVFARLHKEHMQAKMILQIHDELLFEVPEEEVDILRQLVVTEMEGALRLAVPLKVEAGSGDNWFEAH